MECTIMLGFVILLMMARVISSDWSFYSGIDVTVFNEDQTACLSSSLDLQTDLENCPIFNIVYEGSGNYSEALLLKHVETATYVYNFDGESNFLLHSTGKILNAVANSEYISLHRMLSESIPVYFALRFTNHLPVEEAGCINTNVTYSYENCSDPAYWTFEATCTETPMCTSCELNEGPSSIWNYCNECAATTVVDANRWWCVTCPDAMNNCTECTAYNSCTACDAGLGVNSIVNGCEECLVLIDNCTTCVDYNHCTACEMNLVVNAQGDECVACSVAMQDCEECESHDRCTACGNEKILSEDGASCQTCSDAMPGCTTCFGNGNCTACDNASFLKNDYTGCEACSKAMENCVECESSDKCTSCEDDKMLSADGTACESAALLKEPSIMLMMLAIAAIWMNNKNREI